MLLIPGAARLLLGRRRRGLDVVGQPGQTLEQTLAGGGAAGHDVPDLVLELGELESLRDFLGLHGWEWVSNGSPREALFQVEDRGLERGEDSPSGRSCLLA